MKRRETITINIPPLVAKRFREVVDQFGGKVGLCVGAALAMFTRATPEEQRDMVQRLFTAQLNESELEAFLKPPPVRSKESRKRRT